METIHVVKNMDDDKFNEILKNPEIYFKSQPENINVFKELSQKSYSYASCNNTLKGKSLSKLFVNGFDDEQIWQQTDLLNKDLSSNLSELVQDFGINTKHNLINVFINSKTKSLPSNNNKSSDSSLHNQDPSAAEEEYAFDGDSDSPSESNHKITKNLSSKKKSKDDYAFDDDDSDSPSELNNDLREKPSPKKRTKEEYVFDDDDDSDSASEYVNDLPEKLSSKKKPLEEYAFDDDSDSPSEFSENKIKQISPKKKSKYKSVVDDQFFKLSELEDFLKIEDIKEERGDENPPEDEINLFQDIPSDDCDEDSDEDCNNEADKSKKSARYVMYDDFFDDPDSEVEDENDDHLTEDENPDYSFERTLSDAEMENGANEENDSIFVSENNVEDKTNKKSTYQLQQEKIDKQIQDVEKSMLQPLDWHLTGEVAAASRPIDSLIHHDTEFESNVVKDHLGGKDFTERIEEITVKAVMNKAYNDVERKYKPTEEVINYKKEVALDQTKSKKSLAEVYEEDYLKKQNNQDTEEEDPKHKEIKKLMDSLFPQLHALFSHIPKPAVPEIKIVSNLPAITVEEVAPTSVSDATLLAPEEVKKKSGLVKGQTERTDTDRKRERRKKKVHQRLKEKKRMKKLEEQKGNPSAKVSKLEKMQTLKKLKQHKNTKIASVDEGGKIKSSKDFFSRLQDTVSTKRKADNKSDNSSKKKKK